MQSPALPDYEIPEVLVYGTFRDLTKLDWALGIYAAPKIGKPKKKPKKKKPPFEACQVSGLCESSSQS